MKDITWPEGRSKLILAKDGETGNPTGLSMQPEAGQGQCSSQNGYVIS